MLQIPKPTSKNQPTNPPRRWVTTEAIHTACGPPLAAAAGTSLPLCQPGGSSARGRATCSRPALSSFLQPSVTEVQRRRGY